MAEQHQPETGPAGARPPTGGAPATAPRPNGRREGSLVMGVDLGTTNSVAAVVAGDHVVVIPDAEGRRIHPSVVSWHKNGTVLVGAKAKQRRIVDPRNTVYSAKRLMGRRFGSPELQSALPRLPYEVREGPNEQPVIVTRGGEFTVPEVAARLLAYLKQLAEGHTGRPVDKAVICVPAAFNDAQREATKAAGRLAGLEVLRILNEPTAAALAYGYGKDLQRRVAIFDFGGGTFDVTILNLRRNVFEVLATAGDTYLGGDDIDLRLVDFMVQAFQQAHGVDLRADDLAVQRLRAVAEQIKCQLSTRSKAVVQVQDLARGPDSQSLDLAFSITREGLNGKIADIVERAFGICDEALRLAKLKPARIEDVVLVGGTTKMPIVRERVGAYFAREPRAVIHPDEVIAVGAAIQGAALTQDVSPTQTLLLDVTPRALGVKTVGGWTETIIQRNAQVPTEQTRLFVTSADSQTQVRVEVCQGEARRFDENVALGAVTLDGLRAAARGAVQVAVTFEIDTDGILRVRARDEETGRAQQARIQVLGAPSAEDVEAMLARQRGGGAGAGEARGGATE